MTTFSVIARNLAEVTKQSDHFIDDTDTYQQTHNLISQLPRLLRCARNDKMIKHKTPIWAFCACACGRQDAGLAFSGSLKGSYPGLVPDQQQPGSEKTLQAKPREQRCARIRGACSGKKVAG
jgi:hypothetical protein